MQCRPWLCFFFFFNDTATTEIYTLSLHDALPISTSNLLFVTLDFRERLTGARRDELHADAVRRIAGVSGVAGATVVQADRKSTRLNSSHANISYAVFCLKKKTTHKQCTQAEKYSS